MPARDVDELEERRAHDRIASVDALYAACSRHGANQNQLLGELPLNEYVRLLRYLEPVSLPLGWRVNHTGDRKDYLHFLTSGIVARVRVISNGKATALTITGNEGVIGIASFLSGLSVPGQVVVLAAGHAYRLRGDLVRREIERRTTSSALLLRYTAALLAEIGQNVACNRCHSVEQQLCRYLLSFLDRLPSNEVAMTHCSIAGVLGMRREGLTVAAGRLQDAGLIHCGRGRISVLDRSGLEARSCECYTIVASAYRMQRRSAAVGALLRAAV